MIVALSTRWIELFDQITWIWLLFIFSVVAWSVWAGLVRPAIDRRWPGAVDRVIDRVLPLPVITATAPYLGGRALRFLADPPAGSIEPIDLSSPRPAAPSNSANRVISFPRSAVDTAGEASGAPIPDASPVSPVFARALALSLHVESIARELYLATTVPALNADGDRVQVAGLVFEQLPPRVREAYRAAAEVSVARLDVSAHIVAIDAGCSVAPNFALALDRYYASLRHRPSLPASSIEARG